MTNTPAEQPEEDKVCLIQKNFTANEWEEVFDSITDPIVIVDKDYNILKANKAAYKALNINGKHIIGRKCYKLFHENIGPIACPCAKIRFDKNQQKVSQEIYYKSTGKTFLFDVYPRFHKNGKIKDLIHITKDITKIKQAEKSIRAMAITDFLTGVYNQRHFYHQLDKEIEKIMRYKGTFSLILFDIDGFKDFNDKYGHLEGDNALAKVGEIVRQKIRKIDSAYRYGGDEFVILMPQTNKTEAFSMAERLLESFRNSVLITGEQELVYKTLSIGVTEHENGDNLKIIIDRVDKAMYVAKNDGGNKIYMF